MSSTVGYGIEVLGDYISPYGDWDSVTSGDFEMHVSAADPSLQVVTSQPEYSDTPKRVFVMIRNTVVTAGNDNSANMISIDNVSSEDEKALLRVLKELKITVAGKNNWFLVDYFAE